MYTRYRRLTVADILVFPAGVTPKQAAAGFTNRLTALGMLDTMRLEGHTAMLLMLHSSRMRELNDSTKPLRHGSRVS